MGKILSILLLLLLISACKPTKYSDLEDGLYAELTTNKGAFLVELYSDKVPMTVANFIALAEGNHPKLVDTLQGENFYKGILFHRLINKIAIQAGGYSSKGRKDAGYFFASELPRGNNNQLVYKHDVAGTISMANADSITNSSHFFITFKPIPSIDGQYPVFGKIITYPNQLKTLKKKYKDSLQLQKAIDSTRMSVAARLEENDTILSLEIIKLGRKALDFDAAKVFEKEAAAFNASIQEKKKSAEEIETKRYANYLVQKEKFLTEKNILKSVKTSSGLQVLKLKETNGKKAVDNKPITVNYILYIADGKKIQSSYDVNGTPLTFRLDDQKRPMMAGFKEGILTMREGEKARLFIPYYIAYGEDAFGPFPAKSDLVFDVEILKID